MVRHASPEQDGSLPRRVWRSIFRGPLLPRSDRERKWVVFNTLVLHLRPLRVPVDTIAYTHTFGLGGMTATLLLLLVATGALLMFAYEPSSTGAHASVVALESEVPFGPLVRAVHHWSANLVVVVVVLHLLRVLFTGGYRGARQFNWIVGLTLLACVLASNFTGYLLPWDQRSYWAVTIVTGMAEYVPLLGRWLQRLARGGSEIGTPTLINFYTLHTTLIPVALGGLMALHFWRVRKAGGVISPVPAGTAGPRRDAHVPFLPDLLVREAAVAAALLGLVLLLAVLVPAPLGPPANPGMSPNPAKAPWYFMGFQELLLHFDPLFAIVVLPLLAAGALALLPYRRYDVERSGPWLLGDTGRRSALFAAVCGLVAAPLWILLDEYVVDPLRWFPGLPSVVTFGMLPFAVAGAALLVFRALVRRRFETVDPETVQALFVLVLVVFVVFTATGVWFRGEAMALSWPWNT